MGVSFHGYVGTYICVPEVTQEVKIEGYRCSSPLCKNHQKMTSNYKFCPLCGEQGENYTQIKQVTETVNLYDFVQECNLPEDELTQAGEKPYWFPNVDYGGFQCYFSDYDESASEEISQEDIQSSKQAFLEKYNRFLSSFKHEYGVELEVKFGLLTYYN